MTIRRKANKNTSIKVLHHMTHTPSTKETISQLFEKPFFELLFAAHAIHQQHFDATKIQTCALLSIKTGSCPEDCAYCPQSAHYDTSLEKEKLLDTEIVIAAARKAKKEGATRFCMGAAWRNPPKKAMPELVKMIQAINALGMETCMTLGMLDDEQTKMFADAGLDYYNHNLDTSPEHYKKIISTRTYQDRIDTLNRIGQSSMKTCCGGILGMGETRADRIDLLYELANLERTPDSVPINSLIPIPGTPLADQCKIDNFEFIRTIAVARIILPTAYIRLAAGREDMSEEMHALCYFAGANSIFLGSKLLTRGNPDVNFDKNLFAKLGMACEPLAESTSTSTCSD